MPLKATIAFSVVSVFATLSCAVTSTEDTDIDESTVSGGCLNGKVISAPRFNCDFPTQVEACAFEVFYDLENYAEKARKKALDNPNLEEHPALQEWSQSLVSRSISSLREKAGRYLAYHAAQINLARESAPMRWKDFYSQDGFLASEDQGCGNNENSLFFGPMPFGERAGEVGSTSGIVGGGGEYPVPDSCSRHIYTAGRGEDITAICLTKIPWLVKNLLKVEATCVCETQEPDPNMQSAMR